MLNLSMPEKESTSDTSSPTSNVDLNSLADLSFGPSWADEKNARKKTPREFTEANKYGSNRSSGNITKDRRGQAKFRKTRPTSYFDKKREHTQNQKTNFVPRFDIKIYPQDETFDTLLKQLKGNFKTYQLFEITRLILEKSDRFVCLINRTKKDSEESAEPIYFTPEDNLPFDTEEEAVNHYCEHYLENFFDVETVEVDAPKGNFSLIYRCPFTKHLIGPPNFHRFQELLKIHHSTKIKNISIEDYQNKLEGLSDENTINEWLQSTKQQKHYRIKTENGKDEVETIFITIEEAKHYLITNHKDTIVRTSSNFRFSASKLDSLPKSDLKLTILQTIDAQRRFPLDTANNIRGRLRRHKFTIYKKGSKGISYVCCVKRKFRDDTTVFTDSINDLITFIGKNQHIGIQNLPYKFLSMPKPVIEKNSNPENKNLSEENIEISEKTSVPKNSDSCTEEEANKITEVIRNVRWLITEGYVTEYSDGKLWVHPKAETNHSTKSEDGNISKQGINDASEATATTKNEESGESIDTSATAKEDGTNSEQSVIEANDNEKPTGSNCDIPNGSEDKSSEKESVNETKAE